MAAQHFQPNHCVSACVQLHNWATLTPGKELLFKYRVACQDIGFGCLRIGC